MSGYLIAPAARDELEEIWNYYAVELQNPDAADRISDEIFDAFAKLVQTPELGHFLSVWPPNRFASGGYGVSLSFIAAKSARLKLFASCTGPGTFR
jgi:plasmid stabilization system protein ParE